MRSALATGVGKTVAYLSRRLDLGGGTTFPGEVARRIDPQLLPRMAARLSRGCVIVTGTNGKTTTSRIIANVLRRSGLSPVHNRAGANLLEGITSALLNASDLRGRSRGDIGIFEVDEATLPEAVAATQPRVVVVTNLFRDQLDRYGEVDHVAALWRQALSTLPAGSTAVLNADDPAVASLGAGVAGPVLYFGLDDARHTLTGPEHAADAKNCLSCGTPLRYTATFYGHVGHYRCPNCGVVRPKPAVSATELALKGTAGSDLRLSLPQGELAIGLPLPGLYNVYNALAAATCCAALQVTPDVLQGGLESFATAFGRIERIAIDGKQVFLALVKNPIGFDEVLRTLFLDDAAKDLVIVINDNLADGTDISWLWDVDFEMLHDRVRSVTVAGTRAEDMQLRLKYALVDPGCVSLEKDLPAALARGLANTPAGGTLYILPTYTAMLEMRRVMAARGYVSQFWED